MPLIDQITFLPLTVRIVLWKPFYLLTKSCSIPPPSLLRMNKLNFHAWAGVWIELESGLRSNMVSQLSFLKSQS